MVKKSLQEESLWDTFKLSLVSGIGLSLGFSLVRMIFVFLCLIFILIGYYIYVRENKKPKEQQSKNTKYFAIGMIFIGVVVGGGLGMSFLMESAMETFQDIDIGAVLE